MSAPIAGGAPATLATVALDTNGGPTVIVSGLAVDDANLYWTQESGEVMEVSRVGGVPVTIASDGAWTYPTGIAIDGTSVYWVDILGNVKKVAK